MAKTTNNFFDPTPKTTEKSYPLQKSDHEILLKILEVCEFEGLKLAIIETIKANPINTQINAECFRDQPDFSNSQGIANAVNGINKNILTAGYRMSIKNQKISEGTLISFKIVGQGNASDIVPQKRVYAMMKVVRK